jgi:hypothetical protein
MAKRKNNLMLQASLYLGKIPIDFNNTTYKLQITPMSRALHLQYDIFHNSKQPQRATAY